MTITKNYDAIWRHDDVIKRKQFPRYWPFVRGIHRSPVNSQHKGQWRRALMFSLICTWIHGWVNNGEAGDLRRHRAHYDVTVMVAIWLSQHQWISPTEEFSKWLITHLSLDKMATISQTIFLDAFSWMKSFVFWSKFHRSLFLRVQFTITQHWFIVVVIDIKQVHMHLLVLAWVVVDKYLYFNSKVTEVYSWCLHPHGI